MKLGGTTKVEITDTLATELSVARDRMSALTRTLGPALNLVLRDCHVPFTDFLSKTRSRKKGDPYADPRWKNEARKALTTRWNQQLAELAEWQKQKAKKDPKVRVWDARAFLPVRDYEVSASIDHLLSRFSGEHLRDLLTARQSLPSWRDNVAVYYPGRDCSLDGTPTAARITLPLFGKGPGAVTFEVQVNGRGDRARWQRLVHAHRHRDEVKALESELKRSDKKGGTEVSRMRAQCALEEKGALKTGRIAIKRNKRRGKWFAHISWVEYRPDSIVGVRQSAGVNFGCNVFVQAIAEDGADWDDAGFDIREARQRWNERRRRINRSKRQFGSGSRGRGKKRRELPLTRLSDAESRWALDRIRKSVADLVSWALRHNVGRLVLLDHSGLRENFEQKTDESAPEQVKRFIHSWPFYRHAEELKRHAAEHGIVVTVLSDVKAPSSTCPECHHVSPDNVFPVDYASGEMKVVDGHLYRRVERSTAFLCQSCGTKGKGDVVTCCNLLAAAKCAQPLAKMQEKARKRVTQLKGRMKGAVHNA